MDLIEIVKEALGTDCTILEAPQRIVGGLTNENWLVRIADKATTERQVVVRIGNSVNSVDLQIDRHSEAAVLTAVAQAGIGARLVFCAPERHLLVTEYIAGRTWNPREARRAENIERIAAVLRRLHAVTPPVGARTIDLRTILASYWNTLMARGLSSRAGSAEQRDRARKLVAELAADATACLCHNDIHHLNVVESASDGGELRLVDWEYAGIGDPYFDFASICCYHAYSDALRAQLLHAYLGAERPSAVERLHRMCWVFDYIRELWFAVREMK